jgi:Skp family chaperone for outer membrane proteins
VRKEKGLHFVFNAQESGLVAADPGLDITADVIKKLDSVKPAAGAKPPID